MRGDQLLYKFWSSFGLPAYDNHCVPDDAAFPYIAYQSNVQEFGTALSLTATLWDNNSSFENLEQKAEEIRTYISRGGRVIADGDTGVWITWGTPFESRTADPDKKTVKAIVININAEFFVR